MNNILSDEVLDTIDEELRTIIKKFIRRDILLHFHAQVIQLKRLQISKILVVIIMVIIKRMEKLL